MEDGVITRIVERKIHINQPDPVPKFLQIRFERKGGPSTKGTLKVGIIDDRHLRMRISPNRPMSRKQNLFLREGIEGAEIGLARNLGINFVYLGVQPPEKNEANNKKEDRQHQMKSGTNSQFCLHKKRLKITSQEPGYLEESDTQGRRYEEKEKEVAKIGRQTKKTEDPQFEY